MLKKLVIISFSLIAVLAACAPQEQGEAKLKSLKKQLIALEDEIATLEADLGIEKEIRRVPIEVQSITRNKFERFVDIESVVESDKNSILSPQMGGIVRNVLVDEGDYVKAGQTIMKIDDSMQQRRLAEAENRLEFIRTLFERQERVWEKKAGSEIEYLKAKNDLESMEKSIEIIKEEISMLSLKAPFSGIIDRVNIRVGEMIAPGQPAIQLTSNSGLKARAELSENYIHSFSRGEKVSVRFPDLDIDPMDLSISSISKSIDAKNRVINVFVNIPDNKRIQPNMICVTRLKDMEVDSAIIVPVNLVQRDANGTYVYLIADKEGETVAKKRQVVAGESYNDMILIKEGLTEEDVLITVGSLLVNDGDYVEVSNSQDISQN